MLKRTTAVVLAIALAGLIAAPADAGKKKKKPKAVDVIFQMNWQGDCAGGGYLSLETVPNPDSCALFFPGLGTSYTFPAIEGTGFKLNAKKGITVDFQLDNIGSAAADFEALLEGDINGKTVEIASATTQFTSPTADTIHFDLDPADKLHKGKVRDLYLTITWTGGVTYSTINFDAGAPVVIPAYK